MEKIRWSHEAEQWLKEIYEYIAQDNPSAAEKVVSGIYDKVQLLSDELVQPSIIIIAIPRVPGQGVLRIMDLFAGAAAFAVVGVGDGVQSYYAYQINNMYWEQRNWLLKALNEVNPFCEPARYKLLNDAYEKLIREHANFATPWGISTVEMGTSYGIRPRH